MFGIILNALLFECLKRESERGASNRGAGGNMGQQKRGSDEEEEKGEPWREKGKLRCHNPQANGVVQWQLSSSRARPAWYPEYPSPKY